MQNKKPNGKMRSSTLTYAALLLLPGLAVAAKAKDCHGKVCNAFDEYCSVFLEGCDKCANICDPESHNYHMDTCLQQCAEFIKYEPLKSEIYTINTKLNITLIIIIVLFAMIAIHYAYKSMRWLRHKRCLTPLLKKLHLRRQPTMQNGKDVGGTTIQNVMTINDAERAQSNIYSTAGAEGSVMTMTTPVSTRYPAEDTTTPSTPDTTMEHSYVNPALAVTPVADKPHHMPAF